MKKMIGILLLGLVITLSACNSEENDLAKMAEIYNNALAVEQAADLYCADTACETDEALEWTTLVPYIAGIDESKYDFTANNGIVAQLNNGDWEVYMERSGTGDFEFPPGLVPSLNTKAVCVSDDN